MKKNALEWIVFALSLLILGTTVVALLAQDRGAKRPPEITLQRKGAELTVRNVGGEAAQDVVLQLDDATVTLDYLPEWGERRLTTKARAVRVIAWESQE